MSITDVCRRCEQRSAWLIRPVREVHGIVAVETSGRDEDFTRRGWYEAVVCSGCGYTQFWAREYEPGRAPQTMDACIDCGGGSGWRVDEVPQLRSDSSAEGILLKLAPLKRKLSLLLGGDGWRGTLAVNICAGCFAAAWFCRPETVVDANDLGEMPLSPRACSRCQGAQTVEALKNAIVTEARVRLFHDVPKHFGRFEVDICRHCFAVDWHATNLHELREDQPLGVFRIERGQTDGDSGPYR